MLHRKFAGGVFLMAVWFFVAGQCLAAETSPEPETLFTTQTADIYVQAGSGWPSIGKVLVATRLTIHERQPGWLKIEVRGWHREGAERVLYALPGKRILSATLGAAAVERIQRRDAVTDPETGITWAGAALEGWIRDEAVTPDLDSLWASAWTLFTTRCTVCHQRRIPHKYTANQWTSLLKVMGPRTGLPKDGQRLILKFLQNHAKDTGSGAAVPSL